MSIMRQVRDDEPLMIAWKAYLATDDYQDTFAWAGHEEHRDGSLWAAFMAGFKRAEALALPARSEPVVDGAAEALLALRRLEAAATWVTEWLDLLNDRDGTALGGPQWFELGRAVAQARSALPDHVGRVETGKGEDE